jgi:glycosyltransferase involved in cell wall biosynthesis
MGGEFHFRTQHPANFEYLGWQSQEETIRLLSETDLLYLPYWFSDEFYEESCNSFPSKLVTYFATGRPVICHAPNYASPAKYIKQYEAGYLCESLDSKILLKQLEVIITDAELYRKVALNGTSCFMRDFTLENMKATFFQFLNINNE